jgi:phenol hydroxylase P0 protein
MHEKINMTNIPDPTEQSWNIANRFIRIVQERDNGMVEFEFAVGEPSLFVEMVMPRPQFDEFCAQQGVKPTYGRLPQQNADDAQHEWDWSLHDAREHHFRNRS